jgi:hypothetical protein
MYTLQLLELKCKKATRRTDEVYFKIYTDSSENSLVVPSDPSHRHTWHISREEDISFQPKSRLKDRTEISGSNLTFNFNKELTLELFDYDRGSQSDNIAVTSFVVSEGLRSSPIALTAISDDCEYEITFKYLH